MKDSLKTQVIYDLLFYLQNLVHPRISWDF